MMRRLRIPVTLGALIGLGAAYTFAQDLETVRAHVPFAFKIGHATLPAGDYELRIDDGETPGVLRVRRQDGRRSAFVMTERAEVPRTSDGRPKLVFTNDGSQYVLAEIVDPGDGVGVQVLGTRKPSAEPERVELPAD